MSEQRINRRLAAILAADVVGYSRLMGADEAGSPETASGIRLRPGSRRSQWPHCEADRRWRYRRVW